MMGIGFAINKLSNFRYSIFPDKISLATRQVDIKYINIRIIQHIDD